MAVTFTDDKPPNLDLCLEIMAFSSEGSYTCQTVCDTVPRFMQSHSKDRHLRPLSGI
jgi:hypothetical protein